MLNVTYELSPDAMFPNPSSSRTLIVETSGVPAVVALDGIVWKTICLVAAGAIKTGLEMTDVNAASVALSVYLPDLLMIRSGPLGEPKVAIPLETFAEMVLLPLEKAPLLNVSVTDEELSEVITFPNLSSTATKSTESRAIPAIPLPEGCCT